MENMLIFFCIEPEFVAEKLALTKRKEIVKLLSKVTYNYLQNFNISK